VGFILNDETYVPLENKVADMASGFEGQLPEGVEVDEVSFAVSVTDYLRYSRELAGIVHSHRPIGGWENNAPSVADLRHQMATAVPWYIFVFDGEEWLDSYSFTSKPQDDAEQPYRAGLFDEFTCVEEVYFERRIYFREDGFDLTDLFRWLVLARGFLTVATGWEEGDVGFFGETDNQGITDMALYTNGGYRFRRKGGELQWATTPPANCLYQHLRNG
jgi:proteasome lid subunit RPN8/RPN11|tara:strand:+ start:38738 stop:39391 length:654 start_codon:yes stop_codon:yes gene_type:complete